jgi:hypothetical protein
MVFDTKITLETYVTQMKWDGYCNLFMSSGNFGGINLRQLADNRLREEVV